MNKQHLSKNLLKILLDEMKDTEIRSFLEFIFREIGADYFDAPGSRSHHHAYTGGLAYHSVTAASLGADIAKHYNLIGIEVDKDLVVAGILLHDIGKMCCYKWNPDKESTNNPNTTFEIAPGIKAQTLLAPAKGAYEHTEDGKMLHHIPVGFGLVSTLARDYVQSSDVGISKEKVRKLLHIILSHHGRKAWSSPVIPQFIEAYIVHAVEMMDSYVDKFDNGEAVSTIYDGVNY